MAAWKREEKRPVPRGSPVSLPDVTADRGRKEEDLSALRPGEAVMGMICWNLTAQVDILAEEERKGATSP